MPEITYIDEGPNPPKTKQGSPEVAATKRRGGVFVVFLLFLSLAMGAAGSVGMLLLLNSTDLGARLGLSRIGELDLGIGKTEKLVLEESSAVIDAASKVSPAVVSITTSSNIQDFFGRTIEQKGGGTGFIITSDGLIVTNKHVVSDDRTTYTVLTNDGEEHTATVLARDSLNDLAVIKIEATGLPVVELGDSTGLKVGQWVIAIGNALAEFDNSVTVGVISAKERQITADGGGAPEELSGLLQTDAAINPGNSGGPLINLKGQVVGINTAIAGNAEGIGFAIPIDLVKNAIESVKTTGEIKRPMIGIRYVQITKDIAQLNNLSVDYGVLVSRGANVGELAVIPGSPADKVGIEENDIITEINGKRLDQAHSLLSQLSNFNIGDTITLTVLHDGEEKKVELTLAEQE